MQIEIKTLQQKQGTRKKAITNRTKETNVGLSSYGNQTSH